MKKRIFIAINLPQEVKQEIGKLISLCKKIQTRPVFRYVKTKGLHLTLHFLGYLDERQINQVKIVLKNVAKNYKKTELVVGKIDAFPSLAKPRVIFLSSKEKGRDTLIDLQKELGRELEEAGLSVESRPWQPHLTLARIVGPCQFKSENLIPPKLTIGVESLELMESQTLESGAEYEILESYELKS